jgi:hypothetical protein
MHSAASMLGSGTAPTLSGRFHLTWRSPGRHGTVNPEWFMAWYFNFENGRGLSFHAYALPGRPASHACVRPLDQDARWLFEWGEEWKLDERRSTVVEGGTPVDIRGRYDYGAAAPWLRACPAVTKNGRGSIG